MNRVRSLANNTRGKTQSRIVQVTAVVIFAGLGTYFLGLSRASTPTASIEPETGTIASNACSGSDASASGSAYVKFGSCSTSSFMSNLITDASLVFTIPSVSKPAYLQTFTDATFHTKVTRIAGDAGGSISFSAGGSGTWGSDVRQHYQKDQPWSSDNSLIAIQNVSGGSPSVVYLDGSTYLPKYAKCGNYSLGDDRWHPAAAHPHERINVSGSVLDWFDVTTCTETKRINLGFSANGFGMGEGNPSFDGRYVVLVDSSNINMYAIDMQTGTVGPATNVSNCGAVNGCSLDWVSVSPSGKYAVVSYDPDNPRVYDLNPTTLALTPHAVPAGSVQCNSQDPSQGWLYGLGHADMSLDPFDSNSDVMVGQDRTGSGFGCPQTVNGSTVGSVIKVKLSDDTVTSLTSPSNEASSHHISLRSYDRPGWAYVTYYTSSGKRFSNEIIAVKIDGSKQVQRFVHTHSTAAPYRNEEHGVPSRDGTRIIFASGWDANCGSSCGLSSNPQAYVVDARP